MPGDSPGFAGVLLGRDTFVTDVAKILVTIAGISSLKEEMTTSYVSSRRLHKHSIKH